MQKELRIANEIADAFDTPFDLDVLPQLTTQSLSTPLTIIAATTIPTCTSTSTSTMKYPGYITFPIASTTSNPIIPIAPIATTSKTPIAATSKTTVTSVSTSPNTQHEDKRKARKERKERSRKAYKSRLRQLLLYTPDVVKQMEQMARVRQSRIGAQRRRKLKDSVINISSDSVADMNESVDASSNLPQSDAFNLSRLGVSRLGVSNETSTSIARNVTNAAKVHIISSVVFPPTSALPTASHSPSALPTASQLLLAAAASQSSQSSLITPYQIPQSQQSSHSSPLIAHSSPLITPYQTSRSRPQPSTSEPLPSTSQQPQPPTFEPRPSTSQSSPRSSNVSFQALHVISRDILRHKAQGLRATCERIIEDLGSIENNRLNLDWYLEFLRHIIDVIPYSEHRNYINDKIRTLEAIEATIASILNIREQLESLYNSLNNSEF